MSSFGEKIDNILANIRRKAQDRHTRFPADFSPEEHGLVWEDEHVEIVLRMEEAFGFSISDRDAEEMKTVGQTVRYLWRRSFEQSFTLRQRPDGVCQSVFLFHEIRRLLIIRGGVQRTAVRLESRLGELLPSWYLQFWNQVQGIFGVDLSEGKLLTFSLRLKKKTTIRELIALLTSAKK